MKLEKADLMMAGITGESKRFWMDGAAIDNDGVWATDGVISAHLSLREGEEGPDSAILLPNKEIHEGVRIAAETGLLEVVGDEVWIRGRMPQGDIRLPTAKGERPDHGRKIQECSDWPDGSVGVVDATYFETALAIAREVAEGDGILNPAKVQIRIVRWKRGSYEAGCFIIRAKGPERFFEAVVAGVIESRGSSKTTFSWPVRAPVIRKAVNAIRRIMAPV